MTRLPFSGPLAGSRRFWVTVLLFLVANVAAWVGYVKWQESRQPRRDILAVQRFTPGEGSEVGDVGLLTWTFNLEAGKPGAVEGSGKEMPGTIVPAVKGQWSWSDGRTLTFEPAERLARATLYTVSLNNVRSAEGFTLGGPVVHRFSTTPLRLLEVRQAGFDEQDRMTLELEFNDKVVPGEVLRHLEITTAEGRTVQATLLGQGAGTIVRVQTEPVRLAAPTGSGTGGVTPVAPAPSLAVTPGILTIPWTANSLRVTITPGLTGEAGPLGIAQGVTRVVQVSQVMLADGLKGIAPTEGNGALLLTFNREIGGNDVEAIRPLLSVEPAVEFTAARRQYSNGREMALEGAFVCGTRYTVTIGKAAGKDDPQKLPRPTVLSAAVPDRPALAQFADTAGFLGSKGNRTVLVKAVNVPAVRIRAKRVYESNVVVWRNTRSRYYESEVESFAQPLAGKRFVLAGKKNQMEELRINLDELLGAEAAIEGTYELELAVDEGTASGADAEESRRFWRNLERWGHAYDNALVTLSDIGLTAKMMASPTHPATERGLVAWALSLSTGQPLANVRVRVYSNKNQMLGEGVTDERGLAQVDHLIPAAGEEPTVVIASNGEGQGKALTWLDLSGMRRNESGLATNGRAYLRSGYEAFLWTPRGVYRPGEEVVLRAIVRGPGVATPTEKMPVRWQIRRPDGRDWLARSGELDADGAAEWRVKIPADATTGYWSAQIGLPGDPAAGSEAMRMFGGAEFQVEEFIPDRIKVGLTLGGLATAKEGSAARYAIGDKPLMAEVQADYLFGQPAANLQSWLRVRCTPATFTTPAFPAGQGWVAGDTANVAEVLGGTKALPESLEPAVRTLDDKGHVRFAIDVQRRWILPATPKGDAGDGPAPAGIPILRGPGEVTVPLAPFPETAPAGSGELYKFHGPWHVSLAAETIETGGRAVSAYGAAEADGLPYYVMARRAAGAGESEYVTTGKTVNFELQLVTPAGEAVAGSHTVEVTVLRESWNTTYVRNSGRYEYRSTRVLEPEDVAKGQVNVGQGGGQFAWKPTGPGAYVVQFADSATRQITTLRLYVGEAGGWNDTVNRDHPELLEVKLAAAEGAKEGDKTKALFHEGQNVVAIVRSPFAGQLLLTVETDTVLLTKTVEMTGTVAEVPLVLPVGAWPNGYIGATVVRPIDASKTWRTHRAFGLCRFEADPADQKLSIALAAPSELRPQRSLDVDVMVTDARGQAVGGAAVALVAVDEGILRLTDYTTPDPLRYFVATRALGVATADIYTRLMPEVQKLDGAGTVGGGGDGDGDVAAAGFAQRHSTPVTAKRVRPVALVSEIVHTDAGGKAAAHLQVPEFLGQLRVMAVAYTGRSMGAAEQGVFVRSPLVVQSSFPRFLAPGDQCEAPLLVINNSKAAGSVVVQLTTDSQGVLTLDTGRREVTLQPGEQKTVMFQLTAKQAVGIGQIGLEARLGEETFSEHVEIPVRPASPAITRGDSLTATADKPLALKVPGGMLAGTETFELRISQRPALGLPEGLAYLDRYPYGCLEQTTSGCFPLVYLPDIGAQIAPGVFEKERVGRKVQAGITRLIGMQTAAGGLAMGPGSTQDWAWGSVYAAHFLTEAQHAGYDVPADFAARLNVYLRSLLTKSSDTAETIETQAYALYVLALAGTPDRPMMNRLGEVLAEDAKRPAWGANQARFHLALAWTAAGRKDLAEKLIPEQLPMVRTTRQLAGNVGSPVRDEALMILTLLDAAPEHKALPGLVEKLSAAAGDRGWLSTQDNAFAVMAMGKYLRATKDEKAFERAELVRGEEVVATAQGSKPVVWTGGDLSGLNVRVSGPAGAKAYVNWLQTGVPTEMPADADHALKIRRQYLREDGAPLAGTVMSGTAVRVVITVETPTALSHVVLEDMLPAGLEPENPRLATAKREDGAGNSPAEGRAMTGRLDVRDDRVIVVTSVEAGKSSWSYLSRAVTPGTYVVPPVRGECMYDPGINSLSGGGATLTVSAVENAVVARP